MPLLEFDNHLFCYEIYVNWAPNACLQKEIYQYNYVL